MNAPDEHAGRKGPCPKCGLRLILPPPLPESVLATPLPPRRKSSRKKPAAKEPAPKQPAASKAETPKTPAAKPGWVTVYCPDCVRAIQLPPHELSWVIECSQCARRFVPVPGSVGPAKPAAPRDEFDDDENEFF
jgi:hypothetical protein